MIKMTITIRANSMIGVESAGWTGCMIGSSADDEGSSDEGVDCIGVCAPG